MACWSLFWKISEDTLHPKGILNHHVVQYYVNVIAQSIAARVCVYIMYMKLKSWAVEKRLWILRIPKAKHALGFPKLSCAVLEMRRGRFKNLLRTSVNALLVLRILPKK